MSAAQVHPSALVAPGDVIATLALSLSVTSTIREPLAVTFAVLVATNSCPAKLSITCSNRRSLTAVTSTLAAAPFSAPASNTAACAS